MHYSGPIGTPNCRVTAPLIRLDIGDIACQKLQRGLNISKALKDSLLINWLAYLYGRIQKPKARPKEGHYEGRGFWIRLYRYASQLVIRLLPD